MKARAMKNGSEAAMRVLRIILLLFLSQVLSAQKPTPASLEGIAVQSDTNTPVAGATVELRTVTGISISATTERDGSFALRDIQPGQYRLLASRSGYVRAEYGSEKTSLAETIRVGNG